MNEIETSTSYNALLVDDEPVLRQAMARAFNRSGFTCDMAGNGQQALDALSDRNYDVIITDLRMPEMHGYEFIVRLFEHDDRPVVIVVTGVTEPRLEHDLRARGVEEILFKPVDYSHLVTRAKELVQSRDRRARPRQLPGAEGSIRRAACSAAADNEQPIKASDVPIPRPTESNLTRPADSNSHLPLATTRNLSGDRNPAMEKPPPQLARSEGKLPAFLSMPQIYWVWPVLTFAMGVVFGWMLR